ncbi:MAG: TetR/AcrR family transcriptional regulator [Solirubrobacterales bacterium]
MSNQNAKRTYDSSSRQAAATETRERICAAAEELFLAKGYARTSMSAVAKAAGVGEATVYVVFENKSTLLNAVILRAVADNDSGELEEITSMPPNAVLPRFASGQAMVLERAAPLIALGESAAQMDAELRPFRDQAQRNLRAAFRKVADQLDDGGLLRLDAQAAADTIYAISSEATFLRMTEGVGMSADEYASWLCDTLAAALF